MPNPAINRAESFNMDPALGRIDTRRLHQTLQQQGDDWYTLFMQRSATLFADYAVFIDQQQLNKMQQCIQALDHVTGRPEWKQKQPPLPPALKTLPHGDGIFFGYDFHINQDQVHLIEVNTNAGGAFFNALAQISQQSNLDLPGQTIGSEQPLTALTDMVQSEWGRLRGSQPLSTLAIIDDNPPQQNFYAEFELARRQFEQQGITTVIADPSELTHRDDGIYHNQLKIDFIYNRLTDFYLQQHPELINSAHHNLAVVSPQPIHYHRFADKHNLSLLSAPDTLATLNISPEQQAIIRQTLPETQYISALSPDSDAAQQLWSRRKHYFFKPATGFGSKGAYQGSKITRKVFADILKGGYIAQQLSLPAHIQMIKDDQTRALKYDIRCYVFQGRIQMLCARLYHGQTTNFRTPGGGFAPVRLV